MARLSVTVDIVFPDGMTRSFKGIATRITHDVLDREMSLDIMEVS